jgi:2-isopropylmalate synthase
MDTQRLITVLDTTLRDGEQAPGASMTPAEKLAQAHVIAATGVDVIEAGFAFSSRGEAEALRMISAEVEGPAICSLARAREPDIDAAHRALIAAPRRRINLFIATSGIHLAHQLRISQAEALARAGRAVAYARELFTDVEFCAMDATRTDRAYLAEVFHACIEAGATTLNVADTVGYATPEEFGGLIRWLRGAVPGIDEVGLSVHCHNDLGLAVANTLAGITAGATQVECTLTGAGERAGNCSLLALGRVLRQRADHYNVRLGVMDAGSPTMPLHGVAIGGQDAPGTLILA